MVLNEDKKNHRHIICFYYVVGNIGNVFSIDSQLGVISLTKELDQDHMDSYALVVQAADRGRPPLHNTTTVEIKVTVADNAPPKFL